MKGLLARKKQLLLWQMQYAEAVQACRIQKNQLVHLYFLVQLVLVKLNFQKLWPGFISVMKNQ